MKIKTALILCAGFGKRLNPITSKIPKPLIKIDGVELLEHTLNLVKSLDIEIIKINTFHLNEEIENFVLNHPLKKNIYLIKDGENILDTGGGVLNLIKNSQDNDFLVFNPDTLWNLNYKNTIKNMIKKYFDRKMQNLLLVVNKSKSFDKRFKGDFELKDGMLNRKNNNNYIYTGCQIINKNLFKDIDDKTFSISKIWSNQLNINKLYGFEYSGTFIHLTDLEIYKKLVEDQ